MALFVIQLHDLKSPGHAQEPLATPQRQVAGHFGSFIM
jgi:hypothetical protein